MKNNILLLIVFSLLLTYNSKAQTSNCEKEYSIEALRTSNVTYNSVALSWMTLQDISEDHEFQVKYGFLGFDINKDEELGTLTTRRSSIKVENLKQGVYYEFYIKLRCSDKEVASESIIVKTINAGNSLISNRIDKQNSNLISVEEENNIIEKKKESTPKLSVGVPAVSNSSRVTCPRDERIRYPQAEVVTANSITVSWTNFTGGDTNSYDYEIKYKISGSNTVNKIVVTDNDYNEEQKGWQIINLRPNTLYEIQVKLACQSDVAYKDVLKVKTLINVDCPNEKLDSTSFRSTNVTDTKISLSWIKYLERGLSNRIPGAAPDYQIMYGLKGFNINNGSIGTINTQYKNLTIGNLTPDTEYDFYIKLACQDKSFWVGPLTVKTKKPVDPTECPKEKIPLKQFKAYRIWSSLVVLTWFPETSSRKNNENKNNYMFVSKASIEEQKQNKNRTTANPQSYEVVYGVSGFTIGGEGEKGRVITSDYYAIITGLTPETAYDFYIKRVCQDGTYWVGPLTLTTTVTDQINPDKPLPGTSFRPDYDKKYIISGWVKENNINQKQVPTYENSIIRLSTVAFKDKKYLAPVLIGDFSPKGKIIDGWQRIEEVFVIPPSSDPNIEYNYLVVELINKEESTVKSYFDDVRVFPFNGSMKSFVYDNKTKKLMAELDENNYATFYEYDKEGGLVRVKKETEKGVYTIQETRSSNVKK